MTAEALLAEIAKKSDFIFAGWNVLMLAGVGVLVASPFLRPHPRVGLAVRTAFGFFAVTHLLGMLHVLKQWASLEDALKFILRGEPDVTNKLEFAAMAPHAGWVVPFHLAFDGFALVAAWWAGRTQSSVTPAS
ncbi:MAG: hypothetical protein ABGY75_08220 [Gemmataceae bacterium]